MAPHHGSLTMSADAVLAWARPARGDRERGPASPPVSEVQEMLSVGGQRRPRHV